MRSSVGERRIYDILRASGRHFVEEYAVPDLYGCYGTNLRYDFAVLAADGSVSYFIEFQGEQHYRPVKFFGGRDAYAKQKNYDLRKQQYCRLNGIPLVTVPFYDIDRLDIGYIEQGVKDWQTLNQRKSETQG